MSFHDWDSAHRVTRLEWIPLEKRNGDLEITVVEVTDWVFIIESKNIQLRNDPEMCFISSSSPGSSRGGTLYESDLDIFLWDRRRVTCWSGRVPGQDDSDDSGNMTEIFRGVWTRHDLHLFYTFWSLTTKLSKKNNARQFWGLSSQSGAGTTSNILFRMPKTQGQNG